jgi:hypothetical protein
LASHADPPKPNPGAITRIGLWRLIKPKYRLVAARGWTGSHVRFAGASVEKYRCLIALTLIHFS